MIIHNAKFIASFPDVKKCPVDSLKEFAFAGRSNVGKSSLINMLVHAKDLAKTSSTPGKTQTINYFLINDAWNLVDLPGYGYAKVSRERRTAWNKMVKNYLIERENLMCLFLLIDSTILPQEPDLEFANWCGENAIPFALIFTKTDKKNKVKSDCIKLFEEEMLKSWETLPPKFISSVKKITGKDEILNYIDSILHPK